MTRRHAGTESLLLQVARDARARGPSPLPAAGPCSVGALPPHTVAWLRLPTTENVFTKAMLVAVAYLTLESGEKDEFLEIYSERCVMWAHRFDAASSAARVKQLFKHLYTALATAIGTLELIRSAPSYPTAMKLIVLIGNHVRCRRGGLGQINVSDNPFVRDLHLIATQGRVLSVILEEITALYGAETNAMAAAIKASVAAYPTLTAQQLFDDLAEMKRSIPPKNGVFTHPMRFIQVDFPEMFEFADGAHVHHALLCGMLDECCRLYLEVVSELAIDADYPMHSFFADLKAFAEH